VLEIAKDALVWFENLRTELKGELDNWNGAEINPSNYRHDDVRSVNDHYVGLFQSVERLIGDKGVAR
jgi:hypothetical protein